MTLLLARIIKLSVQCGEVFLSFLRHLLFLQVETIPYHSEILRWDPLSSRCVPVLEWVLGNRSLFLMMLLNHLPQEIQILRLCVWSRLLLHSVFWDKFLMRPIFPILQYQQSVCQQPVCLPSTFSPRSKHIKKKNPGKTLFPNWWIPDLSLSRPLGDFHQCTG